MKKHPLVNFTLALILGFTGFYTNGFTDEAIQLKLKNSIQVNKKIYPGIMYSMAITSNGNIIAGGFNGYILLWDLSTNNIIHRINSYTASYTAKTYTLAFSPDNKLLAAGGNTSEVIIIDVITGKILNTIEVNSSVSDLEFSNNGELLVCAMDRLKEAIVDIWITKEVILLNVKSWKKIQTITNRESFAGAAAITPNNKLVASGWDNGKILLWESESGEYVKYFNGHDLAIKALDISSNGKLLASGSYDSTCRIWDIEKGTELYKLEKHSVWWETDSIDVQFAPNKPVLVTSDFKHVYLWSTITGKKFCTLEDAKPPFVFSPNGSFLITKSTKGNILIWEMWELFK